MTNKNRLEIINNNLDVIKEIAQSLSQPAILTYSEAVAQKIALEYLQQMSSSANSAFVALSALEVDKIKEQEIAAVEENAEIVYDAFEATQPTVKKLSKGNNSEIETQYNEVASKLAELEIALNNFSDKKNNKAVVSNVRNTRLKRNVVTGVAFTAALAGIGMLLVNNSKDSGGNLDYKLKIEALENELADYKAYMTTLGQEITRLLNEKTELEEKLKNAGSSEEVANLKKELDRVNQEYEKCKAEKENITKSYQTLQQQNEQLLGENEGFKETIKSLEGQIATKDSEIAGLNSSIETLKGEIAAKNTEIEGLKTQIETYKKLLENAGSGSTGGNNDEALRKQIAELESKLAAANSELAILKSTNESLQNSLTTVTAERDDYYAKYFVASSELQKANAEKEALKSENQGLKDENQGLNAEIERLNKVIDNYKNNGGSLSTSARQKLVDFLENNGNDCSNMSDEEVVDLIMQFLKTFGKSDENERGQAPNEPGTGGDNGGSNNPAPDDGPIDEPNL